MSFYGKVWVARLFQFTQKVITRNFQVRDRKCNLMFVKYGDAGELIFCPDNKPIFTCLALSRYSLCVSSRDFFVHVRKMLLSTGIPLKCLLGLLIGKCFSHFQLVTAP